MKRFLSLFIAAAVAMITHATVTVTKNPTGTVTITVVGEAGQIGEAAAWGSYDYSTAISDGDKALIKMAKSVIIKGNVSSLDMKVIVGKSADNNNHNWNLDNLDMSEAVLNVSLEKGTNDHFPLVPNFYTHINAKTVSLPKSQGTSIPASFGDCFGADLESIVIPEGYVSIGNSAFIEKSKLKNVEMPEGITTIGSSVFTRTAISSITLPNTLESIGNNAFQQCSALKVIVFPASLKSLGENVFNNTKLEDVYFLGAEAPTVHADTFDEGTYHGNNSFSPTTYSAAEPIGDTKNGYAERRNYVNDANTMGLMHLRADLTDEQRAKYTDITRQYERKPNANTPGYWDGFYDLYFGADMVWPGSAAYQQSRTNADNGTLWNGTDSYDKGKYQGLHRFSLAANNVYVTDTKKWPFDRIKGADQWWTICVPFKMTKAQVREVFGENTEVCKLNAVVRDTEKKRITLKFQDEQMSKAAGDDDMVIKDNIAYMIFPTKPLASGEKYIMENYQIETGSPEPTIVKPTFIPAGSGDDDCSYRFIGNYLSKSENGTVSPIYMPKYSYFLGQSGDKHVFFYQTGTKGKWNPFTATVQVFKGQEHTNIDDSFIESSGAKAFSLFGLASVDDTNGIEEVAVVLGTGSKTVTNVYNLNGQIVRQNSDSLEGLKSGIYIVICCTINGE
ncbi:MAG: leucine-rich repeat domain-containing protein [Prevotella sp.]|nr:leucine-rich repeat domain-containing protein [Prevotella sp.]